MASYPLAFRRQLKELVGIQANYTTQDSKIDRCIAVASSWVESQTDRKLSKAQYTETKSSVKNKTSYYAFNSDDPTGVWDSVNPQVINLKNYPIDETEDFHIYYDPSGKFGDNTLIDPQYYSVDYEAGKVTIRYPFGSYRQSLKFVYTAGYEATVDVDGGVTDNGDPSQERSIANNVHPDLLQACLWQAALIYNKQYVVSINARESISEGSTKSFRYVNQYGVAPEASALLLRHRRTRVKVI